VIHKPECPRGSRRPYVTVACACMSPQERLRVSRELYRNLRAQSAAVDKSTFRAWCATIALFGKRLPVDGLTLGLTPDDWIDAATEVAARLRTDGREAVGAHVAELQRTGKKLGRR